MSKQKGIYKITSLVSDYTYIGSAFDFERRKKEHLTKLAHNTHANFRIQKDYNINPSAIRIELIDIRPELNRSQLYDLEQAYINAERRKYNLAKYTSSQNSEGRIANKKRKWRSKYKDTRNIY